TFSGGRVAAYISAAPGVPVVDGLFEEWIDPMKDAKGDTSNPNVDITNYDSVQQSSNAYFYLKVDGEILAGVRVPAIRAMNEPSMSDTEEPADSEPGNVIIDDTPLPVETNEDTIYIFLSDSDFTAEDAEETANGYEVREGFYAENMIEIKGQDGIISSARYMEFKGETPEEWKWKFVRNVDAASGLKEIEASVDAEPVRVCFHVVDWDGGEDWSDYDVVRDEELGIFGTRYVSNPAQIFNIPTATSAPSNIDGVWKDIYSTQGEAVTGTEIDFWIFYYNTYIYMFVIVDGDNTDSDTDYIELYFEKNHNNIIENDDEGVKQFGSGSASQEDYVWGTATEWTTSGAAFDATIADGLDTSPDPDVRTWELKLLASDCGWTTGSYEFGIIINEFDSADSTTHSWPYDTDEDGNRANIDHYGEAVPEFSTIAIPAFGIIALFVVFRRKRRFYSLDPKGGDNHG
ncbi:MAG: hypothetical protein KAU14_00040, partial [Thermoplasmata archaeon]|nr:hypothetical protein [Thermoplasmata archaeon]